MFVGKSRERIKKVVIVLQSFLILTLSINCSKGKGEASSGKQIATKEAVTDEKSTIEEGEKVEDGMDKHDAIIDGVDSAKSDTEDSAGDESGGSITPLNFLDFNFV